MRIKQTNKTNIQALKNVVHFAFFHACATKIFKVNINIKGFLLYNLIFFPKNQCF